VNRVRWLAAALVVSALPLRAQEPSARFQESVSSEEVVVDVHVIDNVGNPITGLSAADFLLRVDGRPVPIQSVEWVSSGGAAPPPDVSATAPEETECAKVAPLPGRLIVLFFQTDYEMSRITGQMRMIREAHRFLDTCSPDDRVAVLSFDSHLKLRQDFTADRGKLRHAIDRTLYFDRVEPLAPGEFPSLAASIDFRAARRATLPEHALRVIGQALEALPGSKSLLFFGWGIGNFDSKMGLILDHNYPPARVALERSHTSVFALDVTSADYHSMEGGLKALAGDTGGLYVKTHVFPRLAMEKVTRAISGFYVLTFARPRLARGRHEMSIRVAGRGHPWVLARPNYTD